MDSDRPRVLVLSSTFPRWENDTEPRFVLDLCRHLSKHAHILVLAPGAPGAAAVDVLEGVQVRRFRYFISRWQAVAYQGGIVARLREAPWRALQLPFFLVALWWATRKEIGAWKPDIIHAHWIIPQGFIACLAAGGDVPVLCTSHGGDLHGLRTPFFRWAKAWALQRCRGVTVVSQSMVRQVESIAPDVPIDVLPMGTDLTELFTPPTDPATRRSNEVVFVGRLVEKKGVQHLLEAFDLLSQSQPELKLTIVGDGPLRDDINTRLSGMRQRHSVTLLGSLPHSDLPAVYRQATIAVFPFIVARDGDQEGFGLVIVEAMGCGCPVIASDLPAVHDNIERNVTGLLTPPGDPVALAGALRRCLSDPPLRARMARAALDSVRRFDWSLIAEQYWQVLAKHLRSTAS